MNLLDAYSKRPQPVPGPDRIWTPGPMPEVPYMPPVQMPQSQAIARNVDPRMAAVNNKPSMGLSFWQRLLNAFPQLLGVRRQGGVSGNLPARPLAPYPHPILSPKERMQQMYPEPAQQSSFNFGLPVGTRIDG